LIATPCQGIIAAVSDEHAARRVLLLGSSSVTYGESGERTTLHQLTQTNLRRDTHNDDWTCLSELLFYSPAMASRAQKMVEKNGPGVAVLYLQKSQFTNEKVVYRIRERWPRLYDRAYALADWWKKKIAGGHGYGAPGPRGWLFRVPLFVAERVIGTAPSVRMEDALTYTRETIDALLRNEDVVVLVKMPKETSSTPKTERQLARAERFRAGVREHCAARHVAVFLSEDSRPTARRRWLRVTGSDGIHATIERRGEQAGDLATEIVAAVEQTAAVAAGR
jgi:hypothetical protein